MRHELHGSLHVLDGKPRTVRSKRHAARTSEAGAIASRDHGPDMGSLRLRIEPTEPLTTAPIGDAQPKPAWADFERRGVNCGASMRRHRAQKVEKVSG